MIKSAKTQKILYWIFTAWLCLGMVSTGAVQLAKSAAETERMASLGYPMYLLTFLGISKIVGAIVVLAPRLPLLKEWAYAGFAFTTLGAIFSHLAASQPAAEIFPAALLLVLTTISWTLRPGDRKFFIPTS